MKRAMFLTVLILLVLCLLVSCKNGQSKTFLFTSGLGETLDLKEKGFEDASESGISNGDQETMLPVEKTTVISPIDGITELNYTKSTCAFKDNSKTDYGDFYCIHDFYKSADLSQEVAYLHNTDLLCFYYNKSHSASKADSVLTPEESREIAEEFLTGLISENYFKNFVCNEISQGETGTRYVRFIRYIDKYATDETLFVMINSAGEVFGYNGFNVMKYSSLADSIYIAAVSRAEKELTQKIESLKLKDVLLKPAVIITNTSGEPYIKINFTCNDNGYSALVSTYTKIE